MNDVSTIVLETRTKNGSSYRVKVIKSFVPFDWTQPDWEKRLVPYQEWLTKLFADEEPFIEFDTAMQFAEYLGLEYAEEHGVSPATEIVTIDNRGKL